MTKKDPALNNPPGPEATEAERVAWRRKAAEEFEAAFDDLVAQGIAEVTGREWSPILERQTSRYRIIPGRAETVRRLMTGKNGEA
jgi:hypothetical protein